MSLTRAVATVGGLTLVSRICGFIRDVLIARIVGAGPVADAFFVALVLPNVFRRIFGEGAFSTAFVPMFARILADSGRDVARAFAEQTLALLFLCLAIVVLVGEVTMPYVVRAVAPGFSPDGERFALAIQFARVTFPYLLLISLVAMLGGVLNSLDRFAAMAATPVLFNLALIAALAVVEAAGLTEGAFPGRALSWGVTASGVLQVLWMVWHCRRERFLLRPRPPRVTSEMRQLGRLLVPAVAAHGVMQINLLVGTMLASTLPVGSVSFLYYADRVNQLPLGVVGVAIATALLPRLTRALRADAASAADDLNRALEMTLLLTLPAAAALLVIAEPVVVGLFQRGAFGPDDSAQTAAALRVFAIGLPAFVLVKVLSTAFFAREDTRTPFRVAAVAVIVNIVAAVLLIGGFRHVGLAAATTLAGWVNAGLLAVLLLRRGQLPLDGRLVGRALRIAIACTAMVGVLAGFMGSGMAADVADIGGPIVELVLLVVAGGFGYGAAVLAFGAARPADLAAMMRRSDSPRPARPGSNPPAA